MTPRALHTLIALALPLASLASADEMLHGLPLHMEWPSDTCLRLWVGDHVTSTAVAAIATERGIVVIDTTESPALDESFREVIAREFGRDDFVYLINTHGHSDHTTGNQVYSDCEIIAHANCAAVMEDGIAGMQRRMDWRREHVYRYVAEERLADAILVFEATAEVFDESWNAFDSLAEARMLNGEAEQAIAHYETSLRLNPGNTNGKMMLDQIWGTLEAK